MASVAFRTDLNTEQQARDMVVPLLDSLVAPGHCMYDTRSTPDPEFWQRTHGDYLLPVLKDGRLTLIGVELKGEKRFTGNLYVETWSNKAFGRSRDGWMHSLSADCLVSAFLDVRAAFFIPFRKLWAWGVEMGNFERYAEKETRPGQVPRTCGRPVPFRVLARAMRVDCYRFDAAGKWSVVPVESVRPVS